jgi:hypothetical protein
MIKTKISNNFDKVSVEFNKFANNIDKATASALNKVAAQARTEGKRAIAEGYTIKRSEIKPRLKRARRNSLRAELSVYSKKLGLSLTKFKATKLKRGVKVAVKRGVPKLLPGAFKATMKSGHEGVFYREGDKRLMSKGRYAGKKYKRQPIVERFGPNVPVLFASRKVNKRMNDKIEDKLPAILNHEIEYYKNK